MQRTIILTLFLLFMLYTGAIASNYVCGDATRLGYYAQTIDPSKVPPCPPPFVVTPLPDDPVVIGQQDALYASVPPRHLKVLDGLMVEMTQAEKDAVDLPGQQQAAAITTARTEMQTNEVCANHTLPEITAYWKGPGGKQEQLQATIATLDSAIAAVPAGTPKIALEAARAALVAVMALVIDDGERAWRYTCAHGFVQP